jgi:Pentapeptide repeats (8 copies)
MIVHHPRTKPEPWSAYAARGWWKIPFLATEYASDWAVYWLSNWSFLETLEYLSSLSVLIAVIFYFAGTNDRIKMRHYQAWQVINTAQGKGGNGGRIDALQELVEDKVALTGVDLSEAFLQGVVLDHAKLMRANFHNADVRNGSFAGADLGDATFAGANFRKANFRGAKLHGADFTDADLSGADLAGADLTGANLENADLRGADLRDVKWANIASVKMTNLQDVKNIPAEFLSWAVQHGAQTGGEQAKGK